MALLGCQETQLLFQDTFSVLLSNSSVGKSQKVSARKGCSCAQPTVLLAFADEGKGRIWLEHSCTCLSPAGMLA